MDQQRGARSPPARQGDALRLTAADRFRPPGRRLPPIHGCESGSARRAAGCADPRVSGGQRTAGTTKCGNGRQEVAPRQAASRKPASRKPASRLLRCAPALRVTRRNLLTHRNFVTGSELPATSGPMCENTRYQEVNLHVSCSPFFRGPAHPRLRGYSERACSMGCLSYGFCPHARVRRGRAACPGQLRRFIPACAGAPAGAAALRCCAPVHPRVCGYTQSRGSIEILEFGSLEHGRHSLRRSFRVSSVRGSSRWSFSFPLSPRSRSFVRVLRVRFGPRVCMLPTGRLLGGSVFVPGSFFGSLALVPCFLAWLPFLWKSGCRVQRWVFVRSFARLAPLRPMRLVFVSFPSWTPYSPACGFAVFQRTCGLRVRPCCARGPGS